MTIPPNSLSTQKAVPSNNRSSESVASEEIALLSDSLAIQNKTSNTSLSIRPNVLPPFQNLTANLSDTASNSVTVEANTSQAVYVNGSELSSSQHLNTTNPSLFSTAKEDTDKSEKDLMKGNSNDVLQTLEGQSKNITARGISNETPLNSTDGDVKEKKSEVKEDLSNLSSREIPMISSEEPKSKTPDKKTKEVGLSHTEESSRDNMPKESQAGLAIPTKPKSKNQSEVN